MMDTISLELRWDVPPKNGLNEFISPELYSQKSVTYKVLRENVYNYYAKFLKKQEAGISEEPSSGQEEFETQNLKPITSRNNRKERKLKSIKCDKQTSSLTAREQKKYLYLLQKYSNKVISAPSETERKVIETLAALHAKVVAEQRKFAEFQKTSAKSGIEYSFIHPEASRYVKELIQKKLQSCLCYSRHYIAREKLSLSEDVSVDSSALPYLVCNLLELGRVPKLISPNLDKCTIQHNYGKMCRRFPITFPSEISSEYSSKKPISQDSIAKTLADKHSADVIISFSSLKHLLTCRSLNCDTSWELPVTVASFPSIEATSCCVKRIFIDKAIPAGIWLPHRINLLYHKYGAKLQFTHFKPSKDRRNTQPFCCGTGENRHNREIRKLQDACFESENFLHETFGQISCSPEKKALVTEASRKKDIKTSDSIHNVKDEDKSVQVANDNQTSPVSNGESLSIIGLNKITKIEFDKDKSDQNCNYFDKENELLLKDVSVATKGIGDILSEEKCFSKILCTTESCHSNTENILKSQNTVNAKCSPDSVLHNYLEQTKESNTDVEERKSSDESAFEESPECKKRKRITKTPVINTGRRVTRSQTKKLEEDTVKHSLLSKKLEFECKTEKANKILKTKQSEITEQSSVQENKNNNQHSEKEAMKIKDLKAVEQEEIQSEFSNDSFPRSVLRRPKLLSSDEDSDDNLVIDEDSSGVDDKQTDLTEFSNCNELNSSGNVTISALNNEEPSHGNISQLQTERTYIHDISKKINITQSENFQSVSIDNPANENSKLSSGEKKDSGSTLDHILHLQEEMLKPKNKVLHAIIEQTPQVSSGPQPGLPTYLEDASQFSPLDPSLNANAQYSLWNMGQLKVIMRSKLDSRQPNSVPCFIFSKLEYQSQFGGEVCSEHELLCQWFTLLCHPGSVGLRVRIDARTSKVLMIENLTLPDMHNLVAKLSPEKPLCWILNVFEKLKGLPDGQYLLAHQKKEDVITVYAATDGSKRGDFDLHTAIRQRLVALDDDNSGWNSVDSKTEVPWLPIDPDVMLPSLVCNNRIPATFPPAKGRETLPKRKRKRSKKKSKATKIKAKFQKM